MAEIVLNAKGRSERGKNAARRLRREGMVPAVIYGGKGENLAVAVDPKALHKVLRSEAGRNAILKLDIAGHGATNAILKSFPWKHSPLWNHSPANSPVHFGLADGRLIRNRCETGSG